MDRRNKMKTIYLFRHGETDLNKNKIMQGSDVNSSLNESGRKKCRNAGLCCETDSFVAV